MEKASPALVDLALQRLSSFWAESRPESGRSAGEQEQILMEIVWRVDENDVKRLQDFVAAQAENAFVRYRIEKNVKKPPTAISLEQFWQALVGCLLSPQTRPGPTSDISHFLRTEPFPLPYRFYQGQENLVEAGRSLLKKAGGIRVTRRIADQLARNYAALEGGLWERIEAILQTLIEPHTPGAEREAAAFVDKNLLGFGPKQSRNLLQGLGATRHEIPIDSRVIKWLYAFGFPFIFSADGLSNPDYYHFVSDGVQALCQAGGILPCILDAAILAGDDGDRWTDENVLW